MLCFALSVTAISMHAPCNCSVFKFIAAKVYKTLLHTFVNVTGDVKDVIMLTLHASCLTQHLSNCQ